MSNCSTPVAFFIFNRPDETRKVFSAIRNVKPSRLFVIADGPRATKLVEAELCKQTREAIQIDWKCEVIYNYSETNLGCKKRVASGLDWVFKQVDKAIIIEDDCLPDASFFPFCEELLEKYKTDTRIGAIGGTNLWENSEAKHLNSGAHYYFSRYWKAWGWATWARAWNGYDANITKWPLARSCNFVKSITTDLFSQRYWDAILTQTHEGKIDTWDYQWLFHNWIENRLFIVPSKNMVANIGFGPTATHTKAYKESRAIFPMQFPMKQPTVCVSCIEMDTAVEKLHFSSFPSWYWVVILFDRVVHFYRWHRFKDLLKRIKGAH